MTATIDAADQILAELSRLRRLEKDRLEAYKAAKKRAEEAHQAWQDAQAMIGRAIDAATTRLPLFDQAEGPLAEGTGRHVHSRGLEGGICRHCERPWDDPIHEVTLESAAGGELGDPALARLRQKGLVSVPDLARFLTGACAAGQKMMAALEGGGLLTREQALRLLRAIGKAKAPRRKEASDA